MSLVKAIFNPKLRAYQLWGTRQGVGKTVASTILCLGAGQKRGPKAAFYNVAFTKPIENKEKDASQIEDFDYHRLKSVFFQWRQGKALPGWFDSKRPVHNIDLRNDEEVLEAITAYANLRADHKWSDRGQQPPGSWLFLETLGNVDTLLPSRNRQSDVYRKLQLPGLLVGDTRPGGVEDTITAFNSLRQREYDVQSVIVFKDPQENYIKISEHFEKLGIPCVPLRAVPERLPENNKDKSSMMNYYSAMARANVVKDLLKHLQTRHAERVKAAGDFSDAPKEMEDFA